MFGAFNGSITMATYPNACKPGDINGDNSDPGLGTNAMQPYIRWFSIRKKQKYE
jgi:hypothetical protein